MKIAFLVSPFPKISETFILNQITGMIDRGHHIEIFARNNPNEDHTHDDIYKYDLKSKAHYSHIPQNKILRILGAIQLILSNILQKPYLILESMRFRKYGRDALSLRLLYSSILFEDKDFDILFCHYGLNGNLGALLRQTETDARVVTMFHGYDVQIEEEKGRTLYKPVFQESDLVLANSKNTMRKLIEFGADPDSVLCHPVGINPDVFSCSSEDKSFDGDSITITTVGRLVEEKGYEYSIRAIADVIEQCPEIQIEYRIIGDGPKRTSLIELVNKLGIADSVIFEGQVDRLKVKEFLATTDIFVLASIEEGFGVVLLEAQATGVPIVATEVGGIPEAVNPEESALLVPNEDPIALAKQLKYLCEHPNLWSKMGEAGEAYVQEHYDIRSLNNDLENIFKSLIYNDGNGQKDNKRN